MKGLVDVTQEETMETGIKFDIDKLRWDLLPLQPIEDVVKILTFGSKKYGPNNWKQVEHGQERYYAALMRHIVAYQRGEKTDSETGLSHLSHAICNLIFLEHFEEND